MERRNGSPESWCWDTAEGRRWLTRLVGATLSPFGRKRGVGMDTSSAFFSRLHRAMQVGRAPGALRGVVQTLEQAMLARGHAWEQDATAGGEVPESMGAVDETFLAHLRLVFLDLPTGDVLREDAVEDCSYATGLKCLSLPEVFPLVHAIVQRYALAIGRQLRQARQELQKAHDRLQRPQALAPRGQAAHEATRQVEATQAGGRRWEAIQSA